MKIAILVDVRVQYIDTFNQGVEDLVNSVNGRLIYRLHPDFRFDFNPRKRIYPHRSILPATVPVRG